MQISIRWDTVRVNTPVKCRHSDTAPWQFRHFSRKGPDGKLYAFLYGASSWTAPTGASRDAAYPFMELARDEDFVL